LSPSSEEKKNAGGGGFVRESPRNLFSFFEENSYPTPGKKREGTPLPETPLGKGGKRVPEEGGKISLEKKKKQLLPILSKGKGENTFLFPTKVCTLSKQPPNNPENDKCEKKSATLVSKKREENLLH